MRLTLPAKTAGWDHSEVLYSAGVADALFEHPRLAAVYDALDPDRSDLEVYAAIVAELGARRVLDVGCGTGTFALLLAEQGLDVVGVDPAEASLAVARAKAGAGDVRWIHGDAATLPALQVDLATMTGNVAQAIAGEDDWLATLRGIHAALRPGGHLVFETRDPARRAWEGWTHQDTCRVNQVPGVGRVRSWEQVIDVDGPLVTFRSTRVFDTDGVTLTSLSTLRFRTSDEVAASLTACGYVLDQVRDAPDRPGLELVFLAHAAQ